MHLLLVLLILAMLFPTGVRALLALIGCVLIVAALWIGIAFVNFEAKRRADCIAHQLDRAGSPPTTAGITSGPPTTAGREPPATSRSRERPVHPAAAPASPRTPLPLSKMVAETMSEIDTLRAAVSMVFIVGAP